MQRCGRAVCASLLSGENRGSLNRSMNGTMARGSRRGTVQTQTDMDPQNTAYMPRWAGGNAQSMVVAGGTELIT